jgi:hypothetical protein
MTSTLTTRQPQPTHLQPYHLWLQTLFVFLAAFMLLWGTAVWAEHTTSPEMAYFNYLADSFLAGRLYIPTPPSTHDLTRYQTRWFVPFPPLPALLMLPWVAWAGLARTSTVLFSTLMGAANATFVFLILQALAERGWSKLKTHDNYWLTLLFCLGTVHWYMAVDGQVWYLSQICTVTFMALAVWLALKSDSGLLVGLALALALASRPTVVFVWVLLLGIVIQRWQAADPSIDWGRLARWIVLSALPVALVIVGLLWYNAARFNDPFDFGYLRENIAQKLIPNLRDYGQFDLHFVPINFWAMWLALPEWDARAGLFWPDPEGMSMLITTPALIYLVRAWRRTPLVVSAWLSIGLLMIPLLLYYNTGWGQFGYRFSMDFIVPVMVLLAVAAGDRVSWLMRLLIIVGVVVNGYGVAWWFGLLE